MRIPTLLVALAACSSALASAGPPAPGPDWFASHRAALAAKLPPDAVVVLRAPSESEDLLDAYRPDSNFWYLTGFSEPDAIAVFRPRALEGKRYTLFVKPKSWAEERWTGRRVRPEFRLRAFDAGAASRPPLLGPALRLDEQRVALSFQGAWPEDRDRVRLGKASEIPEVRVRPVGIEEILGFRRGAQDHDRVQWQLRGERRTMRREPVRARRGRPGRGERGRAGGKSDEERRDAHETSEAAEV